MKFNRSGEGVLHLIESGNQHLSAFQFFHAADEKEFGAFSEGNAGRSILCKLIRHNFVGQTVNAFRIEPVGGVFGFHVVGVRDDCVIAGHDLKTVALPLVAPQHGDGVFSAASPWVVVQEASRSEGAVTRLDDRERMGFKTADTGAVVVVDRVRGGRDSKELGLEGGIDFAMHVDQIRVEGFDNAERANVSGFRSIEEFCASGGANRGACFGLIVEEDKLQGVAEALQLRQDDIQILFDTTDFAAAVADDGESHGGDCHAAA